VKEVSKWISLRPNVAKRLIFQQQKAISPMCCCLDEHEEKRATKPCRAHIPLPEDQTPIDDGALPRSRVALARTCWK